MGFGENVSSPSGVRCGAPTENALWRIHKAENAPEDRIYRETRGILFPLE